MQDFVHLHVHTQYSILDGQASIPKLVDKAIADGMKGIAVTDHGDMFGIKEFFNYVNKKNGKTNGEIKDLKKKIASLKSGKIKCENPEEEIAVCQDAIEAARKRLFKPIFGCEMYVARRRLFNKEGKSDQSGYHLVVLAKNKKGYHIEKILEPYKDDRHGFKNIILDSIIESGKLNKVLLETYVDDFTMENWHAISKMNLWRMYDYELFSSTCPIREFINYRLVLQNNPIPVPVVYSLFMESADVRFFIDYNMPVFKFEDNWFFVFSFYQFSQYQISKILYRYKGTQYEHDIFWYILRCQYVDEYTLEPFKDVIMSNTHLKEKYESIFVKDTFKNRRLKKKADNALRKCLTSKGLKIQKDSVGEYVEAACIAVNYDYFTAVEITKRYYRVLEQAPVVVTNTAFTTPRTAYFVIENDSNAVQFKVYLENITMGQDDNSNKITLISNRILKI